jgi:tetratricopeptide (TPR) repeat protein
MAGEETASMSEVVPLLKFTPSAQDPEVLEAITVQRESLIAKLVEVALDTPGGARHQLLIGPRGIGKTHILSLVASRVRAEDADLVALAWLDEDPWGVGSYEKFLAAIVGRLAAERADAELEASANALHATRDGDGRQAEQVLRDAVGDSRLVLLIENLDEIFRRIGPNGQERFRALIEDWQQMLVIATAPQLFEGVQLHESPFYGFFAITHLEELSLESAGELMRRVAELRNDQALVRFLATEVARRRLAAVEALAGGHPRIWLLLSGCVSIYAIDELVPLFLEALDDLTPYYQDRLRELGDQQQELVVFLSEAGGALSNRELSERSGIAQNQVATILRQLTDRGYVRRAEVQDELASGDARMSYWELREPLMRLCLDVKQARGKPLRMVVEFLRAWYGPKLLDELVNLPESDSLAATYAGEAFRMLEGDLPTDDLLRGSPEDIVTRAERGLVLTPGRIDLGIAKATGLLLGQRYDEAVNVLRNMLGEDLPTGPKWAVEGLIAAGEQGVQSGSHRGASVMDLVEKSSFDSSGFAVLVACSYQALGLNPEALALFRQATELDPLDIAVLRDYGILASQLGENEEALRALTRAVDLDPKRPGSHTNRSIALGHLGRYDEAIAEAHEAIDLAGDNASVQARAQDALATVMAEAGRYEEALAASREACRLEPTNGQMVSNMGTALGRMGRDEDALKAFEDAAKLDPENPHIQANLALALFNLDRSSEARQVIEGAVELDPERPNFRVFLGRVLLELGYRDEAINALRAANDLAPHDGAILRELADVLRQAGRAEEALQYLRRAVEQSPDSISPIVSLATTLGEMGRPEESLSVLDEAIRIDPGNPLLKRNQCAVFTALARYDDALRAIDEALELRPESAEYHEVRGVVLSLLGRSEPAIESLERATEIEPENPDFHKKLGVFFGGAGRLENALSSFEKALDLHTDATLFNLQADVLRQLGHLSDAKKAVARAIELDPSTSTFFFTAAEIALADGDGAVAISHIGTGLEVWAAGKGGWPGETDVLCQLLWESRGDPRKRQLIAGIVDAYEDAGAAEALGVGLVSTIALFLAPDVSQQEVDDWIADWAACSGEAFAIPLDLLRAARDWKQDHDRAHILRLPHEQREIVMALIEDASE